LEWEEKMTEPLVMVTMASTGLAGLSMLVFAGLKGWQGWLDVRKLELTGAARPRAEGEAGMAELIEMADLKERIRKLEKIAACVDL
jgi:hypothetical protein